MFDRPRFTGWPSAKPSIGALEQRGRQAGMSVREHFCGRLMQDPPGRCESARIHLPGDLSSNNDRIGFQVLDIFECTHSVVGAAGGNQSACVQVDNRQSVLAETLSLLGGAQLAAMLFEHMLRSCDFTP